MSSVCKRLAAAAVLLLCTREGLDLSFPDPSLKYEMDYKYPEGYFIEHPHLLPFQYRLNCSRFLQWAPLLCKLSIDEYAISRQAFPDFMANAKALRELSVSCTTQMALAKVEVCMRLGCPNLVAVAVDCRTPPSVLPSGLRVLEINFRETKQREDGTIPDACIHRLLQVPSLRSLTVQYPDSLTGTTVLPWLEDLTLETCIGTEQSDPGPSAFTWFWEQPCKRKHLVVFVNTCGDGPEDPYRGEPDWHDEFLTGLPQNQLSSVTLSVQMWDPPPSSSLLQRWQALTISGEVNIIDMPWP